MLQRCQIIPKTRLFKKKKYALFFNILVCLVILIITCYDALKIKASYQLTDKIRSKVLLLSCQSSVQQAWISSDIVCFVQKKLGKMSFSSQESRLNKAVFSNILVVSATSFLKEKRLNFQLKIFLKRTIVLTNYRFFILRNILEKNQTKIELIANLSQNKDSLSMVKGLVLGIKDTKNSYYHVFKLAGLLHILVASGFNISLLAGSFKKFLGFFSSNLRFILSLLVIWLYVWLLGWEPPLLRAALMFSLVMLANRSGNSISSRRILFYSASILLTTDLSLLKSLSFWFSFLATIGLILFSGQFLLFNSSEFSVFNFFKQEFLGSLVAQIFILPLVILIFNDLNWLSFISNTIFLFPIAWFTQVGFLLIAMLAVFKDSFFRVFIWPISLIYSRIIIFFIFLVNQLRVLFFLDKTVLPEEKCFYLLLWLVVLISLTLFLRRKNNRKVAFFHENI